MSTATALERARVETDAVRDSAATPVATAEQMEITDLVSCQQAAGVLGEIAGILKTIEARRKEIKQPIVEAGRNVDALFKEVTERIKAADERLREKYRDHYQRQRFEATPNLAPKTMRGVRGGTVTVKMVKDFEIVDSAALERAFLVADKSAIRRAIDAGATEIPGVKIIEKPVVSVRE